MNRFFGRIAALTIALSGLAACSSLLPPSPPAPLKHDFGLVSSDWSLGRDATADRVQLARISMPDWLDNANIHYRALRSDPTGLRVYARNRWAASPARLMAACLARSGIRGTGGPATRLTLSLYISDFEQVITAPEKAHLNVLVDAWLRNPANGHLIAHRRFVDQQAVPANVTGAVEGLARAGNRQCRTITVWTSKFLSN